MSASADFCTWTLFVADTERKKSATVCLNCGGLAPEKYCPFCGQRTGNVHLSFKTLMAQMVDAYLNVDGTLFRTLGTLFFRPGTLTREYWAGKQVRFLRPFHLYVVASFIFFLSVNLTNGFQGIVHVDKRQIHIGPSRPSPKGPVEVGLTVGVDDPTLTRIADAGAPNETRALNEAETANMVSISDPQPETEIDKPPDWLTHFLEQRVETLDKSTPGGAQKATAEGMARQMPNGLIVLQPVFALLLKLFYRRRPFLYGEHFIFSLHLHAFFYLLWSPVLFVPGDGVKLVALALFALHTLWSLRKVYDETVVRTLVKAAGLFVTYLLLFTFSMIGMLFLALYLA
jgi:Protein of unknown function (DUF3667)